jgi:myo-inositol-1(or 4)-monophosphatase
MLDAVDITSSNSNIDSRNTGELDATTRRLQSEIISFLLPHLVTAGHYSTQIQQRIAARPAKEGSNSFQQALSDADLSVQGFLEVALLSRFPEIAWFSEEFADSLNLKYFTANSGLEILLDPIDGTRSYLDGAPSYQIIVTFRQRNSISAVLCHMPRREVCYAATRGGPALALPLSAMKNGLLEGAPIRLSDQSRRVILFNAPGIKSALGGRFDVIDIYEEYVSKGIHHGFTEMLAGEAAACIHPKPQLIDAAAIAFLAQQAGGTLTGLAGETLHFDQRADQRGPGLVVSASAGLHQELLECLCKTKRATA